MTTPLCPQVRALIEAANLGDTEAFLAAFVPHLGVVDDWGRKFHGQNDIQKWSDAEFIGQDVRLSVINFYETGDSEVTVIANVGGNGFNGPSTFTFHLSNDKIAEMRITA